MFIIPSLQAQHLSQEFSSILSKPNFQSLVCYAVDKPLPSSKVSHELRMRHLPLLFSPVILQSDLLIPELLWAAIFAASPICLTYTYCAFCLSPILITVPLGT